MAGRHGELTKLVDEFDELVSQRKGDTALEAFGRRLERVHLEVLYGHSVARNGRASYRSQQLQRELDQLHEMHAEHAA